MTDLTRRKFTSLAGASFAALATNPLYAPAVLGQPKAKAKLVVIGGGPAGGTVARYVNNEAKGAIDVTMIEPIQNFTTCFFSNIYVGGYRSFQSITHNYNKVRKEGVRIVAAARQRYRSRQEAGHGRQAEHPLRSLAIAPGIELKWDSVARLFGSRLADHAACLEARRTDAIAGEAAQCAQRRRADRDDRAAQSLPLPARPL